MGLYWSTKTSIKKAYQSTSPFTGPDCKRTIPMNSDKADSLMHNDTEMLECKVILEYVLSSGSAVKFNVLKSNPDKTHSVSSHKILERNYLESLTKKDSIKYRVAKNG